MSRMLVVLVMGVWAHCPCRLRRSVPACGTVTDIQGDVIPNAQIEARNLETNRLERTVTNTTGYYALPVLDNGRWIVTASGLPLQNIRD